MYRKYMYVIHQLNRGKENGNGIFKDIIKLLFKLILNKIMHDIV